jgi:predicted transcriptional regulator YdeE
MVRLDALMAPKLEKITPFTVRGIRARTINRDEGSPKTAKIPGLWGRFHSEHIADTVPGRVPDATLYGVYSSYESDASGAYDLTLGVCVSALPQSPEFEAVEIEAGDYLVFEGKGPMPRVVIDTWSAIWKHFESEKRFKRKYTTDFEVYRGADEVAIHIAVTG